MDGVTTDYILDGQSVVREMRGGSVYATYLTGMRGPEYRKDASGDVRWYLCDGLGSIVGEVDETCAVTATRKLDVYGLPRGGTGTPTSDHAFVGGLGHVSEGETGLIYMRARYMDPVLGRFVSEDSARDGTNWYAYCNNDAVNLVDRDGENSLPVWAATLLIGAAVQLGVSVDTLFNLHKTHPYVSHIVQMMGAALVAFGSRAAFIAAAGRAGSYRSPTGAFMAAATSYALALVATVEALNAVKQVALTIMLSTDPVGHASYE